MTQRATNTDAVFKQAKFTPYCGSSTTAPMREESQGVVNSDILFPVKNPDFEALLRDLNDINAAPKLKYDLGGK